MPDVSMGDSSYEEFESKRDPNGTYFMFRMDPNGDGLKWSAQIISPSANLSVVLSHEALDAYIYSLQDIKQRLELLRIRNA